MPKAKQRRTYADTVAPTPEWLAKGPAIEVEASIDNANSRRAKTFRRISPIVQWHKWGWINGEQVKALVEMDTMRTLVEEGLGATRSCLNTDPPGGNARGGVPEHIACAMARWERVTRELGSLLGDSLSPALRLLAGNDGKLSPDAKRALVRKLAVAATEIF